MSNPNDRSDPLNSSSTNLPETANWQSSEVDSRQSGMDSTGPPPQIPPVSDNSHPDRIGRYRIERVLGKGAFGTVYRAYDETLKRPVAIKVPHCSLVERPEDIELYLDEAQVLARLDHPAIVPVYDVGQTEDGLCYVVSKFIEGSDLAKRIKEKPLSHSEAAELVATIAEALHHAHRHMIVHRDVKPGNILIDTAGKSYLADFGLALKEEAFGAGSGWAGTPAYMSPEQARGEGHLVDGRADIFSLGVVFYELLTATRPFWGTNREEIIDRIRSLDARPPRQLDDSIPKALERICLKALSKRATDRYTTALDMAEDLRHFLVLAAGGPVAVLKAEISPAAPARLDSAKPTRIVPKGLRSFDAQDADFFLELLPGPRDRDGLPESIRFWKHRIETTDADKTFRVGLIYGPSGCGKSSLVKAGLLPRLAENVISVCTEATCEETEARLLRGLRKRCPALAEDLDLADSIASLRRGRGVPAGKKVLIVLDQFEQWLHAKQSYKDTELVKALRQCDGEHVQCIVMVRVDFWLAVSRFMQELEIPLVEGQNSGLIDLFDIDHARKVLAAFGRAFDRLPEKPIEVNKEQIAFLEQASTGLAEQRKVVCVRLALFAEMMKSKPWTPASLKAVGGTEGVGITFLEETFSVATAPPEHRLHQKAARAVLKVLLPESGTEIKGQMRSQDELLQASSYASRLGDFGKLIRILDAELRLITPTTPEGREDTDMSSVQACQKYYQLTHDYLVPSLRDWLTRKQKETPRGRAELRLAERAALWNAKPENRQLPSLREFLNIRLLTHKKHWTDLQRKMMEEAARVHGIPSFTAVGLLKRLLDTTPKEVHVLRNALARYKDELIEKLWAVAEQPAQGHGQQRLRAASALATFDAENERWAKVQGPIADDLVAVPAVYLATWIDALRPVRVALLKPLVDIFRDPSRPETERSLATDLLMDYAADQLEMLADLLMDADAKQFAIVYPKFEGHGERGLNRLLVEIGKPLVPEGEKETLAKRQANAAVALLKMGKSEEVWPLLKHSPDPRVRSWVIHRLDPLGADARVIAKRLENEPDVTIRRALVLSLGEFGERAFAGGERDALIDKLREWYRSDPDPGLHAAVEWLLRQWKQEQWLKEIERGWANDGKEREKRLQSIRDSLARAKGEATPQWYVNGHGQTMVVIPGPVEFMMGSPESEAERNENETMHRQRIGRSFAIAAKSVTVEQFKRCMKDFGHDQMYRCPEPNCPILGVIWYEAAAYCNWLSKTEGMPESEWCYEPNKEGDYEEGMRPASDFLKRTGYRLPTEAEWEYACRAGSRASRHYGDCEELLGKHGWYVKNSSDRSWPVGSLKPNDLGLFDMHGNMYMWCHDSFPQYRQDSEMAEDAGDISPLSNKVSRVLRGGGFFDPAVLLRSARRYWLRPVNRIISVGFRLARTYK